MAMKGYPTLVRSPELEPYHLMRLNFISRTPILGGIFYPTARDTVCIFQVSSIERTVDLGVIEMKRLFTLLSSPELKPHPEMQFRAISTTLFWRVLAFFRGSVCVLFLKLLVCSFGFYGISTFVDYLIPNLFLYK